jgi:hypothetical protein
LNTHSSRLTATLTRLHAAIIGNPSTNPAPLSLAPSWACERPHNPPTPLVLASYTDAATVRAGLPLSRGAGRIFDLLHGLAVNVARARAYAVRPDTVTLHLPASLLALGVGYTPRHLRRLLPELEDAGLIACGAHASKVRDMSLWDGYLWAVKVSPGDHRPRLRREEWKHRWRDFAGDIEAGRTVKALLEQMSALHPDAIKSGVDAALKSWAVAPGNISNLVVCSADISGAAGLDAVRDVRELAYRLGELVNVHPTRRAESVGRMASALAYALDDAHSRRWYCSLLWAALVAEQEGRAGLGVLAAALLRLNADRGEWEQLRNPAALLASRLRSVA